MASKSSSALAGAGTGAAVGTAVFPGVGTVVGAGLGAVGGWLLGDDDEKAPSYTPDAANFDYGLGYGVDANGNVVGETREDRERNYQQGLAQINSERQTALQGVDPGSPEYAAIEAKFQKRFDQADRYVNSANPVASDNAAAQRTRGLVSQQQALGALGEDAYTRGAPTQAMPGSIDYQASGGQGYLEGADAAGRAQQGQSLNQLQSQVGALNNFAGQAEGPSAAQAQLQAGTDMAARQQYGFARSQPGGGGSALRTAAFNAAGISGNAANSAATLRANETSDYQNRRLAALNAAMGGAGTATGYAGQARGQDQAFATTRANQANSDSTNENAFNQNQQRLEFDVGANNLQAAGQARGQNDAMTLGAIAGVQTLNNQIENVTSNKMGAGVNLEAAKARGAGMDSDNFNTANTNSRADLQMGLNGASQAAAAYAATKNAGGAGPQGDTGQVINSGPIGSSDERLKDVEHREHALASSLGALDTIGNAPGYSYKYKNPNAPGAAPGRQVSSMAQDLERGPRGHEIVMETPHGKMVDYGAVMKMTPGAITELNHKVAALEKALGGRA